MADPNQDPTTDDSRPPSIGRERSIPLVAPSLMQPAYAGEGDQTLQTADLSDQPGDSNAEAATEPSEVVETTKATETSAEAPTNIPQEILDQVAAAKRQWLDKHPWDPQFDKENAPLDTQSLRSVFAELSDRLGYEKAWDALALKEANRIVAEDIAQHKVDQLPNLTPETQSVLFNATKEAALAAFEAISDTKVEEDEAAAQKLIEGIKSGTLSPFETPAPEAATDDGQLDVHKGVETEADEPPEQLTDDEIKTDETVLQFMQENGGTANTVDDQAALSQRLSAIGVNIPDDFPLQMSMVRLTHAGKVTTFGTPGTWKLTDPQPVSEDSTGFGPQSGSGAGMVSST